MYEEFDVERKNEMADQFLRFFELNEIFEIF